MFTNILPFFRKDAGNVKIFLSQDFFSFLFSSELYVMAFLAKLIHFKGNSNCFTLVHCRINSSQVKDGRLPLLWLWNRDRL